MTFVSSQYLAAAPAAEREAFLKNHISLGYHPETDDDFHIHTLDRYSGVYISGMPGSGKSGLMENMIVQDADADNAVIVLDPHLDLVTRCLRNLPRRRTGEIFVLDMTDEDFPFGINVFATGQLTSDMDRTQTVDRIMHLFDVLWPDVLSQANLPRYLRQAIHVFLANPGTTLPDMYDFLIDDAYRRKLLAHVTDKGVLQFWQLQYDNLPPATRLNKVQPLLGRLEQLFAGHSLVKNIVGQQNTIDFRRAIENKEIILIKLPLKIVPEDARLIGTILVSQIDAALFSFVNLPDHKRPGVSLYIDEFQNFVSNDIAELFTEGRKYGMRITVAHQFRGQLPNYLKEATMTAYTKVVFQSTPEDGRELAHLFPAPSEGVKPEHVDPHPTDTLVNQAQTYPAAIQDFVEWYLLPIDLQAIGPHGNTIELHDVGVSAMDIALGMMNGGRVHSVKVENPIPYLDYLLQLAMVYGDATLPIPALAVRGFANCGHSFWPLVRGLDDNDKRLLSDIPALNIPKHLAVQTPDGWQWTRDPESGREQLLHLLFHIRVTMRYLAAHPLGKETVATASDVGKMLNQLPRRCAWVRSGTKTGTIITHDTPPSSTMLHEDLAFIRDHTREVYCHPKADVEKQFNGEAQSAPPPQQPQQNQPDQPPKLSGWEEAE